MFFSMLIHSFISFIRFMKYLVAKDLSRRRKVPGSERSLVVCKFF